MVSPSETCIERPRSSRAPDEGCLISAAMAGATADTADSRCTSTPAAAATSARESEEPALTLACGAARPAPKAVRPPHANAAAKTSLVPLTSSRRRKQVDTRPEPAAVRGSSPSDRQPDHHKVVTTRLGGTPDSAAPPGGLLLEGPTAYRTRLWSERVAYEYRKRHLRNTKTSNLIMSSKE